MPEVSVHVDADASKVYGIFVDVEHWPEWTDSVDSIERLDDGPFTVGSRVRIKQPRMRPMVWQVTEVVPDESFTWETKAVGVTSRASHHIASAADGGCDVTLRITQRGAFAPVVGVLFDRVVKRYMQMEADGAKRRAEGSAA
jgi:uncharacterized membrane protein